MLKDIFFLYQGNHPGVACGIVTFPVCRSLASLSYAEAQREFWEEEYKRNKCRCDKRKRAISCLLCLH